MRLVMFSRDGRRLATIASAPVVESVLIGVGKLTFTLTTRSQKCKEDLLQYGNLVVLEDDDFEDWCGVVRAPREWQPDMVMVTCHSAAALFNRRRFAENTKLSGTAGQLFEQFINLCNQEEDLRLRAGDIFKGGSAREETLSDRVLTHVTRVQERSRNDFKIRPDYDSQRRLILVGDWYERLSVPTGLRLKEGIHISHIPGAPLLVEDVDGGELVNKAIGVGDAATTGKRPTTAPIVDLDSQARYGISTDRPYFSGNTLLDTVTQNTEAYIKSRSNPTFQVNARVNVRMFHVLQLGNRFDVELFSTGFLPGGGYGWENEARLSAVRYQYGDADAEVKFIDA